MSSNPEAKMNDQKNEAEEFTLPVAPPLPPRNQDGRQVAAKGEAKAPSAKSEAAGDAPPSEERPVLTNFPITVEYLNENEVRPRP